MKQYNRAKQKLVDFYSIIEHTVGEYEEDRIQACRRNKRKTLQSDTEDDGTTKPQSGRSCQAHEYSSNESESSHVQEKRRKFGISFEDGREHKSGCGAEGATEKIGEAA
jgi:hypothetical protein